MTGGSDEQSIREQVEARRQEEKSAAANEPEKAAIKPDFIWECYRANEVGDGILYSTLHRGRFVHNCDTKDEWYWFNGTYWELDKKSARAQQGVEEVVLLYMTEKLKLEAAAQEAIAKGEKSLAAGKRKQAQSVAGRIKKLRTVRGRKTVLEAAATNDNPLTCCYDDLDQDPMLLACANGVLDLRTGRLRNGKPEDYITKASPIHFPDDVNLADAKTIKCPVWREMLWECLENDDVIQYLHKVHGYAITALTTLRIFMVFWGPHGFSGKGTYMKITRHILGPLAGAIPSEMLIAQRNAKSSSGPSPDIMDLKGKRFVWGSETDEGQRFAAARVKLFTGDDELVGRNPNDRHQTHFEPCHTLYLITNEKPHAPAQDNAFWGRQRLIEWPYSFVEEPTEKHHKLADPDLFEKLKAEAPYILAWMVHGCLIWQREGLKTPDIIKKATAAYRRAEDQIQDFIDDCLVKDPDHQVGSSDIYDVFKRWWPSNIPGAKTLSQRKFGDLMTMKFAKDKPKGLVVYLGVRINENSKFARSDSD